MQLKISCIFLTYEENVYIEAELWKQIFKRMYFAFCSQIVRFMGFVLHSCLPTAWITIISFPEPCSSDTVPCAGGSQLWLSQLQQAPPQVNQTTPRISTIAISSGNHGLSEMSGSLLLTPVMQKFTPRLSVFMTYCCKSTQEEFWIKCSFSTSCHQVSAAVFCSEFSVIV